MPTSRTVKRTLAETYFRTYNGPKGLLSEVDSYYTVRDRAWSVTPGLRTAKQRAERILSHGFLPSTAYTDRLQQTAANRSLFAFGQLTSDPASVYEWSFVQGPQPLWVNVTDSALVSLKQTCLTKLQGKLSGQGANIPVTIAEAGKTADMIASAAKNVFLAYQNVRKGQFARAATRLGIKPPKGVSRKKNLASNWMAYRYGWRLSVFEIQSYMKTIYDMLTTRPIVYHVKTSAQSIAHYYWYFTGQKTGPHSGIPNLLSYTLWRDEVTTRSATAGYVYSLESVALSNGQALGLLNLPLVGWELIPLSFVLDWVLNVGEVLEGLTAFQGKKFLDGYTTVAIQSQRKEWWTDVRRGTDVFSVSPVTYMSDPITCRDFSREVLSGFVPGSLRIDYPTNFKNAIDGLALMAMCFRK